MRNRIKDKILTAFVIFLAIAFLTGIFAWFRWQMDEEFNETTRNYLSKNVNALAGVFNTKLEDQLVMLESQTRYFKNVDLTDYNEMKETIMSTKGMGSFRSIGVATSSGSTMNYNGKSAGNILLQDYFQDAMQGKTSLSEKTTVDVHGDEVLVMAVPIKQNGKTEGVVYGTFTSAEMRNLLEMVRFDVLGANVLVTEDGTLLATTAATQVIGRDMNNLNELIPDLQIDSGVEDQFFSYSYDGQDYILVLTPVGVHDWYFGTILHESILTEQVSKYANYVLMAIIAVALVFSALMVFIIITGRKNEKAKRELDEKASRDAMTQLLNKKAFELIAENALKSSERHCLLCMIDIDDFKHVNDTYGHDAGDKVIIETANRIRRFFREADVIGRVGGDEFSVFIQCDDIDAKDLEALICRRADWAMSDMAEPYMIDGEALEVSISVGAAYSPDHGTDYNTLYKSADRALYIAKQRGKNRYEIYR